jgi:hypothetical protein
VLVHAALADEAELRQPTQEWGANLGALPNEHERFRLTQSLRECLDLLDVISPDLDVVGRQLRIIIRRGLATKSSEPVWGRR